MLSAIEGAVGSVRLESYIYAAGQPGETFREALVRACGRGAKVRVLIDALGSYHLPGAFWDPVQKVGGEVRVFNPLSPHWLGLRNHRKLLVCDDNVAFVGGFNIAPEYSGDGVTRGWRDLGLRVEGPLVGQLARTFDHMFERADFRHKRFVRLRKSETRMAMGPAHEQLLLSGPGRGRNPFLRALKRDLSRAQSVQMIVAYFLPTWQVRRQLARVARRGGRVDLILGGKSDVTVSRLAARSLYRRLLRAGVAIHEYQPQILHAKLIAIDDIVYVGSANLDQRSLKINYELMIRFESPAMARQAREVFADALRHSREITLSEWRGSVSLWEKIKQHWAYFLLVRVDPYIARRQWKALPD
jgi:cardiolipin synthase